MKLRKTKLASGIASVTLAMAGALTAPQAVAHGNSTDRQIQALQAQINQLKAQINNMSRVSDPKVQELSDWMASVKSQPIKAETKDNMVFFRGGYARNDQTRNGVSIYSDVAGSQIGLPGGNPDHDGWYIGAGFDFSLNDNLFGLMDNTEVLAELMFEYKKFAYIQGNVLTQEPTVLAGPVLDGAGTGFTSNATTTALLSGPTRGVTVNQFTLTAAPKIKFMKGSAFRPWIIPFGLAIHVVSPPSESITVLNPGMVFGAGADYNLWNNIYIGADARYHLTGQDVDGVNTDGFTAGGYLGIGF